MVTSVAAVARPWKTTTRGARHCPACGHSHAQRAPRSPWRGWGRVVQRWMALGFNRLVCIQTSSQYPRFVTPVRLVKHPSCDATQRQERLRTSHAISANTTQRSTIR
jgi:hypothetical protein